MLLVALGLGTPRKCCVSGAAGNRGVIKAPEVRSIREAGDGGGGQSNR